MGYNHSLLWYVMTGRIKAEWQRLNEVAVHRPGIEAFFGLLNPNASLYERPFSRYKAGIEHDTMVDVLKKDFGVRVRRLEEEILKAAGTRKAIHRELRSTAIKTLKFEGSRRSIKATESTLKLWKAYYDSSHFFDILLLRPLIGAGKAAKQSHLQNYTKIAPLSNLYYMRDQQIVSDVGIFIGSMSTLQRKPEPLLTAILWKALGLQVAGAAHPPASIEGGDFMPMKDFALIGCGSRTNEAGVKQFLSIGSNYDEVAVVHKPEHPMLPQGRQDSMIDMHLDTYFNVAGSAVVVGSTALMNRAAVDIYAKASKGRYVKGKARQNLYEYISAKGFNILDISLIEQMSYASNFLCIKDGTILAVDSNRNMPLVLRDLEGKARSNNGTYGKLFNEAKREYLNIKRSGSAFPNPKILREFGIDFKSIDVENLTGGYGGVHCMTAAIGRS